MRAVSAMIDCCPNWIPSRVFLLLRITSAMSRPYCSLPPTECGRQCTGAGRPQRVPGPPTPELEYSFCVVLSEPCELHHRRDTWFYAVFALLSLLLRRTDE